MPTDIRQLVDPDSYVAALKRSRNTLVQRAAAILVDRNMITDSPVIPEEMKPAELTRIDFQANDVAWRIDDIDAALKAFDQVKEAVVLPKAEREAKLAELVAGQEPTPITTKGGSDSKE